MGMVLNIIGVFSIIVFIGCILFIIYKLIRHGKQSLNLNYFLGIVICVLFFVISIEAGKFYPIENTVWQKIIQVTNTETERTFDETEEVQKIMAGANLTELQAQTVINILKKCGFEKFYFVGRCEILDDEKIKGYSFEYENKKIYMTISDGNVSTIFSGNCYFYENREVKHTFLDWYINKNDEAELKELTKEALSKYAEITTFNISDWRVTKMIDGSKGYLVTSFNDNFSAHFSFAKSLDALIVNDKWYYPKITTILTNKY